ncbi:hypothetical protein [Microvirga thermotolerans]|uniref:Uncharacterized protein n=1 Tax=Microvirga thermotolerans TaxID=2651334 RepID=A0A5P9JZ76_9HYPH|nr:hypothetical protein [Microvirga thermotolerans]QFU16565.1 hypothetical protein GDR74_10180 [Microvirga thermotolerans]
MDTPFDLHTRGKFDRLLAPDDAEWLAAHPETPCRVRPYRAEDAKRIKTGSVGSAIEEAWVTMIFRNGTYVADYFATPSSRLRGALIDRVSAAVEGYLCQNPEWGLDPK